MTNKKYHYQKLFQEVSFLIGRLQTAYIIDYYVFKISLQFLIGRLQTHNVVELVAEHIEVSIPHR